MGWMQIRSGARRGLCVFALSLLLALPARADYEETEFRLKGAGVDDALRERIHTAIDRGVAALLAGQSEDGTWHQRDGGRDLSPGEIALCTLALRHAATPAARPGFRKGMESLFPTPEQGVRAVHEDVYTAGIAAMILMADRSHPVAARRIGRELGHSYEPISGWWGYSVAPRYAPAPADSDKKEHLAAYKVRNLSTTQFAALGMWAGDRLGAGVPKRTWRRHLEALIRYQTSTGSWPYDPLYSVGPKQKREVRLDGVDRRLGAMSDHWKWLFHDGRPTSTFMGLANVLLAESALARSAELEPQLAAQARAVRLAGLDALHRDGPAVLDKVKADGWVGADTYYTLYSLEKVCLFADLDEVGGRKWYVEGATWFCDTQREDGGWGSAGFHPKQGGFGTIAEVDTSFALLFLLRASASYTPRDPRSVDGAAVTPSGRSTPARAELSDTPPPARRIEVDCSLAGLLLDDLERKLADVEATDEALVAALGKVAEAYRGIVPDAGPEQAEGAAERVAAWRERASEVVLSALTFSRRGGDARVTPRTEVEVAAARLLAAWDPAVSTAIRQVFDNEVFSNKKFGPARELYAAAFDTLAALSRPESARWLASNAASAGRKPSELERSRAAILALQSFDGLPGAVRREVALRLVKTYRGVMWSTHTSSDALRAALTIPLAETLRQLARHPTTRRAPRLHDVEVRSFKDFDAWMKKHSGAGDPHWQ